MLPKPNGNGTNHLFALNSLRNNACATALRNVQGMAMANSGGLLGSTSQLLQAMASLSARGAAHTSNSARFGADTSQHSQQKRPRSPSALALRAIVASRPTLVPRLPCLSKRGR